MSADFQGWLSEMKLFTVPNLRSGQILFNSQLFAHYPYCTFYLQSDSQFQPFPEVRTGCLEQNILLYLEYPASLSNKLEEKLHFISSEIQRSNATRGWPSASTSLDRNKTK